MPYEQLLPTTVIGSHAMPGWFWTAMDALKGGEYGPTDEREVYDDAVRLAIWDQKEAGYRYHYGWRNAPLVFRAKFLWADGGID